MSDWLFGYISRRRVLEFLRQEASRRASGNGEGKWWEVAALEYAAGRIEQDDLENTGN